MKKYFKYIILHVLVLGIVLASVSASAMDINVSYNAVNNTVVLNGNANGTLSLTLTNGGQSLSVLGSSHLPLDFHQLRCSGSFTYSFEMPIESDGVFDIWAKDDSMTLDQNPLQYSFIAYSKLTADSIIAGLNNKEKADFVLLASSDAASLGIIRDSDTNNILGICHDIKKEYASSDDFHNTYKLATAIYAIEGRSNSAVKAALLKYEGVLGISYNNDFLNNSKLPSALADSFLNLLSKGSYSKNVASAEEISSYSGFKAYYNAMLAVALISAADDSNTAKTVYTQTFPFLNTNIVNKNTEYKNVSQVTVFTKLCSYDFSAPSDLKSNFALAVQASKTPAGTGITPGSGTGASGGGGGGAWQAPESESDKFDEIPGVEQLEDTKYSIPSFSSAKSSYIDVLPDKWYHDSVSTLGGNGIINGYPDGSFKPDNLITRAEFAKLIVSAFSIGGVRKSFLDVAKDSWYEPYVTVAAGVGIVNGDGSSYMPDNYITRQDAAVIIYRTAKLVGKTYIGSETPSDIDSASIYAWTAIGSLYTNGIINGTDGKNFLPLSNITRAEASKLLHSAILDIASN